MVCVFTPTEVICRLDFAPQFTLSDPTHIGGFIALRFQERDLGRGVALETHQTKTGKLLRQDAQEAKHDELEGGKHMRAPMCVCSMSSELNTIMNGFQ